MFYFKLGDEEFRIGFKHEPVARGDYYSSQANMVTHAYIQRKSDKEERGWAVLKVSNAYCSKQDQFVKAVGRQIALTRVVAHLDREVRKQIWEAYWFKFAGLRNLEATEHQFQAEFDRVMDKNVEEHFKQVNASIMALEDMKRAENTAASAPPSQVDINDVQGSGF